jgi:hypothetical protein
LDIAFTKFLAGQHLPHPNVSWTLAAAQEKEAAAALAFLAKAARRNPRAEL